MGAWICIYLLGLLFRVWLGAWGYDVLW